MDNDFVHEQDTLAFYDSLLHKQSEALISIHDCIRSRNASIDLMRLER